MLAVFISFFEEVHEHGYMWQSREEIKHYSVVYFNRITVLKALYYRTSVKGGAHMHVSNIHEFTQQV